MLNSENEVDIDMLRLKLGLDNLVESMVITNKQREIIYINNSAVNLLNEAKERICAEFPSFSVDALLGKKVEAFHRNPANKKVFVHNLMGGLLSKTHLGNLTLSIEATAILDDTGQHIGFIAQIKDISDKEKRETALLNANKKNDILNHQANQIQRIESISRLTGGVAHDFNNILAVILGYNQLNKYLSDECDDAQLKEEIFFNAHQIEIASKRGADLVKKLMVFSRQFPKSKESDVRPTQEVINEVVNFVRPCLTDLFEIHVQIENDLTIEIDSTHLYQILTHLIMNARDAMQQGGVIALSLQTITIQGLVCSACVNEIEGRFIELCVIDHGVGISDALIHHIFEPFFTTKEVGQGTGLGLSTVSGMVHDTNGHIVVNSITNQENSGTTFRLLFPF